MPSKSKKQKRQAGGGDGATSNTARNLLSRLVMAACLEYIASNVFTAGVAPLLRLASASCGWAILLCIAMVPLTLAGCRGMVVDKELWWDRMHDSGIDLGNAIAVDID